MDFITRLLRTGKWHDSIMVVVENLTKDAHFITLKTTHKEMDVAEIFMKWHDCIEFPRQLCLIETSNLPQISGKGYSRGSERI
jgi:hypothetical protein